MIKYQKQRLNRYIASFSWVLLPKWNLLADYKKRGFKKIDGI